MNVTLGEEKYMKERYEYQSQRSGTAGALFWIFTTAAALVLLIVFAIPVLLDEGGVGENRGILVSDVVDNPQRYAGQVIALEGEVDENIGTRGFTIDGPGVVGDRMLVVSRQPLEAVGGAGQSTGLFSEDDEVIVSGTVRQFDKAELEEELGVTLTDAEFNDYEGRYIFFADTVTRIDQ